MGAIDYHKSVLINIVIGNEEFYQPGDVTHKNNRLIFNEIENMILGVVGDKHQVSGYKAG